MELLQLIFDGRYIGKLTYSLICIFFGFGNMSRPFDRKYSEQNFNAPPSYEEAVNGGRSPTYSER